VRCMPRMTIGELARRAGVGVETVRYYQRRKLFPEPARSPRSTREYQPDALELLRFIRRARGLGFTIKEIERLLALRKSRKDSRELIGMLNSKVVDLERTVREAQASIETLREIAVSVEALPPTERWQLFIEED
jgi:MerR family copper efflux transcriptional regulator